MAAGMKKASVIIQARMGASRLPDKVLMPLAGKPVLEHVIRRCQHAKLADKVIVATTLDSQDLAVSDFASSLGVCAFRGSTNDVLDRFFQTASLFGLQHIVRITADCPMIDPDIIDEVIALYFEKNSDYASNALTETYPDGQDVEVFGFRALQEAWHKARLTSEREHVTPYIRRHKTFKRCNLFCKSNLSQHRWTLDEPLDYQKLSAIFEVLYPQDPFFHMDDVLNFLAENSEINRLNSSIKRNEGYQKSLLKDL